VRGHRVEGILEIERVGHSTVAQRGHYGRGALSVPKYRRNAVAIHVPSDIDKGLGLRGSTACQQRGHSINNRAFTRMDRRRWQRREVRLNNLTRNALTESACCAHDMDLKRAPTGM
jgi:hypothetical protein